MNQEMAIAAVRDRTMRNGQCPLWDLGPTRPNEPIAPTAPDKTGSATEQALAQIQYEDAVEDYKKGLRAYGALKREYDHWRMQIGGPVKIYNWTVEVVRMVVAFPERYVLDLPRGIKPGKAQIENEEREANEEYERLAARKQDPQFGGVRA
jgi:hypothetical protein